MAAFHILYAVCFAIWITLGVSKFIELTGPGRKQEQSPDGVQREAVAQRKEWTTSKRWAIRLSGWCIALALIPLALYLVNVPSFSFADGKWVAGPWDNWYVPCLGALSLAVLALFVDRLGRLGRLGRSTALVLAVSLLFAALYFLRVRV